MNPFGLFLRILRMAGWPPPLMFVQGLNPVLVWHVLGALAPETSDQVRVSWAVFSFVTFIIWIRCHRVIGQAKQDGLVDVQIAIVLFGTWVALAAFVYFSQELAWAQHWITGILVLGALRYLAEIVFKSDDSGVLQWSEEELANGRPTLFVALLLLHVGVALLNETLVSQISFEAWIVWLSVLSVLQWLLFRALTLTVLLSLEESD